MAMDSKAEELKRLIAELAEVGEFGLIEEVRQVAQAMMGVELAPRDYSRRKNTININFRRSARISWIGARPPWWRLWRSPWRAPRAREGGPAPIREIRADLRKLMFMAFVLFLMTAAVPNVLDMLLRTLPSAKNWRVWTPGGIWGPPILSRRRKTP